VALICRVPVVVSPCCLTLPARQCDPKLTASQSTSAENTKRRFAAVQDLSVSNNDEVLLAVLFIMEQTLDLQVQSPASDFSTRSLSSLDWLFQRSALENLK